MRLNRDQFTIKLINQHPGSKISSPSSRLSLENIYRLISSPFLIIFSWKLDFPWLNCKMKKNYLELCWSYCMSYWIKCMEVSLFKKWIRLNMMPYLLALAYRRKSYSWLPKSEQLRKVRWFYRNSFGKRMWTTKWVILWLLTSWSY